MQRARQHFDIEVHFIRAFVLAWVVGAAAVIIAELVVTGKDPLASGVSWQSWVAAVAAAVLAFGGAFAWAIRRTPPSD